MSKENYYYKYSEYLKNHYHEKVYKLPVNLPITCPNRLEGLGCTFCSDVGTGFEAMDSRVSVRDQLIQTQTYIRSRYKATKFIAYFQNYTNTFMPLEQLMSYLQEAAGIEDIVEIAISTRPDCIRDDYLDRLLHFSMCTHIAITIELGLQTANYHTLKSIHRGHGLAEYIDACMRIKKRGFSLCTHVILNLPGDITDDAIETAKILSVTGNDLVKLHSLYIAKGTEMAKDYEKGSFEICSKTDYFQRLRYFLEYLRPDIAVERLFSRIPEKDAIFCNWQTSWWKLLDEFHTYMAEADSFQGKQCTYMNGPALKHFDRNENDIIKEYSSDNERRKRKI
ncbi:TIGR01212 family radical SAM protein [Frisingicoccus sp.]|uniref:TIGR01212 family radical SAM protein n=1 Tax=Frisingicoccus sp. TaxID=1918627 RepID=UPI00373573C2